MTTIDPAIDPLNALHENLEALRELAGHDSGLASLIFELESDLIEVGGGFRWRPGLPDADREIARWTR